MVTGGGGVKRGCVKPLRFRPATPENKIKILDSYSFFHVNLKNTVDIDKILHKCPYCFHPSVRQSTNMAKILNFMLINMKIYSKHTCN